MLIVPESLDRSEHSWGQNLEVSTFLASYSFLYLGVGDRETGRGEGWSKKLRKYRHGLEGVEEGYYFCPPGTEVARTGCGVWEHGGAGW